MLRTKVKSKKEFMRWLRSFGINAEVLEPMEVREQLRIEYEQMLRQYQK